MFPWDVVKHRALVLVITIHLVAVQFTETVLFQVVVVVVSDMQPPLVFAYHSVLKTATLIPRVEMHLPNPGGVVSRVVQNLRPSPHPCLTPIRPQVLRIIRDPVADGIRTCQ